MHYKNALLHYELKWTIKMNYLDKKNRNEDLLISYLDCFWICLLWLMSSCWSGTFKSPLINSHFGTGRLLFGLGIARLTHGDAVPDHDTTELLLYTAYVRLSQNCSSCCLACGTIRHYWGDSHGTILTCQAEQAANMQQTSVKEPNAFVFFCSQGKMAQISPFHFLFRQTWGLKLKKENRHQQLLLHFFAQEPPKPWTSVWRQWLLGCM